MGWEVGRRFKREGTDVYQWLIHVAAWQKPTQCCKAIILQLKITRKEKNINQITLKKRKLTVLKARHFLVVTKPRKNLLYRFLSKRHQTV